jgi:hypothetical protein
MNIISKIENALYNKIDLEILLSIESNISKYIKVKKGYRILANKNFLGPKIILYLAFLSIKYRDIDFSTKLIYNHDIESMNTIPSKIFLGQFYFEAEFYNRCISYLLPIFNMDKSRLDSIDLNRLSKALLQIGDFNELENLLLFLVNRYPQENLWKLKALEYQITINNIKSNKNNQDMIDNLNYMMKEIKNEYDYRYMTKLLYDTGYFQDSFNMFDKIFREKIVNISDTTEQKFNTNKAINSMNKIIDILYKDTIVSFPAFGSLLGLVRDGKLFEHDKDADIGIFIENIEEIYTIVSKICKLDRFITYSIRKEPKESHIWNIPIFDVESGIAIDLFFFYKRDSYYEAGTYTKCSKFRWIFTPFELMSKKLGHREYLIPNNYEEHLSELYGEWRETITVWESLLNCPNIAKDSQIAVIYYGLNRLFKTIDENNLRKFDNIYNTLRDRWNFRFSKEADSNLIKIRKKLVEWDRVKDE